MMIKYVFMYECGLQKQGIGYHFSLFPRQCRRLYRQPILNPFAMIAGLRR